MVCHIRNWAVLFVCVYTHTHTHTHSTWWMRKIKNLLCQTKKQNETGVPQQCCWGFRSSGMWLYVNSWVVPIVFKEHSAFVCNGRALQCLSLGQFTKLWGKICMQEVLGHECRSLTEVPPHLHYIMFVFLLTQNTSAARETMIYSCYKHIPVIC